MPKLVTTNMSINNGDVERRYYDFSSYCLSAQPDILAVQEVSDDFGRPALNSLTKALGPDYIHEYARVYPGQEDTQGVSIVTRLDIKESHIQDFEHGGNKFHLLRLLVESDRQMILANVHLEAHLFKEILRRRKLASLIDRLNPYVPQVLAGDFNALANYPSLKQLRRTYHSAYVDVHGRQPTHTYPTDLGEELLLHGGDANRRQIFAMKLAARVFQKAENRRGSGLPSVVIDHIFLNRYVQAHTAKVIGHDDIDTVHSDHRGLEVAFSVS